VARRVERHLDAREPDGASRLFRLAIDRARDRSERADRQQVAARIRAAVDRSGLTDAQFAERIGTSASRLSTYLSAKVTPSAALLVRIERTADDAAAHTTPHRPAATSAELVDRGRSGTRRR
jgi:ribosome-binding protein aMBF1 (putative translation factor)